MICQGECCRFRDHFFKAFYSLTVDSCVNYINIDLYSDKANVKQKNKKKEAFFIIFYFVFFKLLL